MTSHFYQYIQDHKFLDTIFIIGGGPSIKTMNLEALRNRKHFIICCNQAFEMFPHAQIAHHSDYGWWIKYQSLLETQFKGHFITGCGLGNTQDYPETVVRMQFIHHTNQDQLFRTTDYVYGNNCGLQALSLAHLFQPKNIVLIGFDFKSLNGQSHGYEKSATDPSINYPHFWNMFLKSFKAFERLKRTQWQAIHPTHNPPQIWNLNPDSALTLYDTNKTLEDFL